MQYVVHMESNGVDLVPKGNSSKSNKGVIFELTFDDKALFLIIISNIVICCNLVKSDFPTKSIQLLATIAELSTSNDEVS